MRYATTALLVCLLGAGATASAKARIVAIEITGPGMASPLRITAPEVISSFHIWNGPGVRVNDRPVHLDPARQQGHFIDWPRGEAHRRPAGLQRFTVTFHLDRERAPYESWTRYVVFYAFDPATDGGYIYLPLREDIRPHHNSAIRHGVEGSWFHSTAAWEELIRPRIGRSRSLPAAAAN